MKNILANIENLTSLWQTICKPFNSNFKEECFNYSLIKNSEWPNKLWFTKDIDLNAILLAKEKLISLSTDLTVPYWDIYNSNSFKILEKNGFNLKFEQVGMSLKRDSLFTELDTISLKKVSFENETLLWSELFSKSFGYFIDPILLTKPQKNTTFYIAYHKNEAIGTGVLHTTNNVTGIHSVGVTPEQRRKGYAEQIMKLLINESIKTNSNYITLQSSNMGKRLYLKLGFEEQFTIKNYSLQRNLENY
jgi:ribosomal protein S18 acetylase RimI-like enzyme